jgi:hypothetical protein
LPRVLWKQFGRRWRSSRAGATLKAMTRDEAQRQAERLSREHPERASYRWFARELRGVWSVVRVPVAHRHDADALRETIEARPRPPQPDDPRPSTWRDLGEPNVGPA